MSALFYPATSAAFDSNGDPISAATWNFYLTGTTTGQAVFTAAGVSLGATVTADSAGRFVPIYLSDGVIYRAILKDASGSTILDLDPVVGNTTIGTSSGQTVEINAGTVSIPNNLQFTDGRIGIGGFYNTGADPLTLTNTNGTFRFGCDGLSNYMQSRTATNSGYREYDLYGTAIRFYPGGTYAGQFDSALNLLVGQASAATSSAKTIQIANGTAPSANPTDGGALYVESGALKYRGSGGTITTIANA